MGNYTLIGANLQTYGAIYPLRGGNLLTSGGNYHPIGTTIPPYGENLPPRSGNLSISPNPPNTGIFYTKLNFSI